MVNSSFNWIILVLDFLAYRSFNMFHASLDVVDAIINGLMLVLMKENMVRDIQLVDRSEIKIF